MNQLGSAQQMLAYIEVLENLVGKQEELIESLVSDLESADVSDWSGEVRDLREQARLDISSC